MSDDFRVKVTLPDRPDATWLGERLASGELEHGLAPGAAGRIAVSVDRDDREVFLYADSREGTEAAAAAVRSLLASAGKTAEIELRRWHPTAEEWEDVEVPLPASPAEDAAEHARLVEQERTESAAWGAAEYEVRVQCPSHRDTVELSERLSDEGLHPVRRWRYLLLGASDEDSAQALADRLVSEVPAGATVTVEASLAAVAHETPFNPFAVFGGLGV